MVKADRTITDNIVLEQGKMHELQTREHHWSRRQSTWGEEERGSRLRINGSLHEVFPGGTPTGRFCAVLDVLYPKMIQDVEIRWWWTKGLVERLVIFKGGIALHRRLETFSPLLSSMDW